VDAIFFHSRAAVLESARGDAAVLAGCLKNLKRVGELSRGIDVATAADAATAQNRKVFLIMIISIQGLGRLP
jgi:hypothetical protein